MSGIIDETQNNTTARIDIPNIEHGEANHRSSIYLIFVSQYMDYNGDPDNYVVTYSREDRSVLGWSIEENGSQHDVYVTVNQIDRIRDYDCVLSKKILLLVGDDNKCLIDFNNDRTNSDRTNDNRFLRLKRQVSKFDDIGFLPNGDLIQVPKVPSTDRKIYKYCFTNKPVNTIPWEYSQIIDIKTPESLNDQIILNCSIYRTKLFLIVNFCKMLQFDLLTMNLERQYHKFGLSYGPIIMNRDQTLLAMIIFSTNIAIYSMENGMLIYEGKSGYYKGVKFITLENNSTRLVIHSGDGSKLVDPYQVYDEIDISGDFNNKSVITRMNRKIFIDNGNVCVTNEINGIDENRLQQLSNKIIYRNSIYTLSTFKIIQRMLQEDIRRVAPPRWPEKLVLKDEVEIENLGLCKIVLYNHENGYDYVGIEKNDGHLEERASLYSNIMLSIKLLNNQDLVLINIEGISIYTINENGFRLRYFWNNNEWNNIYKQNHPIISSNFIDTYRQLIDEILNNEFDNSKHSIPFPKYIEEANFHRKEIVEDVINDNLVSPKFGIEMLKIAIEKKNDAAVQQIIKSTQDYSENHMTIISLNLAELCDYYPDFMIKYISSTSIMLSPYRLRIGNSTNTSLNSYTDIYIKESNYFKPISATYIRLIRCLRIKEEIQTVSLIVPFPQICVYQDDFRNNDHENHETENNHNIKLKIIAILKKMITGLKIITIIPKRNSIWNKFLYKPKSILFCNIDSNHFYNWWNFAAIIDFKWKTFGRVYYYLIWLFYTIFYICYSLASTLEQKSIPDVYFKSLFVISIIFGSIFLIFEIRQCLWNYKHYFEDIWNLFGAFLLPIISSIFWLINKSQPLWLTAISIILLSFKFLLFFRVFEPFGIYFAIIIGVAKKVFPFLVLLFFLILGYAQAFFIVLRSNSINDDNDPRNVATKYDFVNPDGTISNATTIIQDPNSNTNLFNWFPTSLLAVYKILTGDSGSLSSFTYREHSTMTILLVTFTFFTVIYLMNLFIGLLNLAIDDYNKKEEFLLQKAQMIMEIELFYMSPRQRNNKKWFPDWIYYDIPITEIRKLINAIDNKQTVFNYPPLVSKELRNTVVLTDDNKKQTKEDLAQELKEKMDELTKQNVELTQQLKNIMELLKRD
ncbi:hypothetical protein GLOIN_2v1784920 [Rhizophagus clarus]|uniref:Ion transport domain-containing protein n=1 Tax=Rhizophagus clarus TaxID=94130 RepID=A0A8H3KT18_9GLOM|nr:hypothetical protein GLOIN_2v1784920 [Rhizophagus clarus]